MTTASPSEFEVDQHGRTIIDAGELAELEALADQQVAGAGEHRAACGTLLLIFPCADSLVHNDLCVSINDACSNDFFCWTAENSICTNPGSCAFATDALCF